MLNAITPLDGRYDLTELAPYVSEYALIKKRLEIEIKYLKSLIEYKIIAPVKYLDSILENFSMEEAIKIKEIEKITRHDVKAVELYLRQLVPNDVREFVHLGITSEDINNIAYRLILTDAVTKVIVPKLYEINDTFDLSNIPMLARTHGQPAAPTTWEHEMRVFKIRLYKEIVNLAHSVASLTGKFNGSVGNFYALKFAYPDVDWDRLSRELVLSFNLTPNLVTTQINPFEDIVILFQNLQRINGILLDFVQDMWRYISDGWVKLKDVEFEVGSSTMPQKVNPIDFENAEGNLTLANGLAQTMIDKLYISRLQRDLSNSTIMRNIGTLLGYCLVSYNSTITGMSRTNPDANTMQNALEKDWTIYAETLQVYLRKQGIENAYDIVKSMTRKVSEW